MVMKVWLTKYEHKHGTDLSVYATEALALAAKATIAAQWWEQELVDEPYPEDPAEAAELYFEKMGERDNGEWFTIEEHDVIGAE